MENPNLIEAYKLLCTSYHAIDDFRAKLLGFLPLATGTGIFLLLDKLKGATTLPTEAKGTLAACGVFGFLITLGLFAFELYGIKKCSALLLAGQRMESLLGLDDGQFLKRPQNIAGIVNEPFASGVIYPATLAAWSFFALLFVVPNKTWNLHISLGIFLIGFAGTLGYDRQLRRRADSTGECDQ